ncbi:MAG: nucleotidyltransferase family protein [Hyphomonadaceae bacterium]|nr:nucleotidyltransferase family protein [Hyphomonadaceae bacterium]
MTRDEVLAKLRELKPWLKDQGIGRVRLFGSYARDEATSQSDVDLLVELARPLGLDFFKVEHELSEKLGAPVEMTTDAALHNRIVRRHVLAEAIDA